MGMRARRRAAVTIGLAGVLGGVLVGMSSVDGFTATSSSHGSGSAGLATQSPSGRSTGGPTHSGSPTHSATSSPARNGRSTASPTPAISATPRSIAKSSPTSSPTGSSTHTPRAVGTATPKAGSTATPTPTPSPNGRGTATPRVRTNTHNPNWPSDSRSWHQWNSGWQDPGWRGEHSRDSRHERGFFHDPDRFCDSHDCDRFHFDEFRSEDDSNDFRHDCDVLLSFHSVRALLDFLDGDSSLRDFFELHGDLYDFLVNHPDWSDDFDQNCTLIDLHL
jgi:hypothetical protein